jgi:tetratricopeptide (TPR) repeat protein
LFTKAIKAAHEPWVICNLKPLPLLEADLSILKKFAEKLVVLDWEYLGCFNKYYAKVFYFAGFWRRAAETAPEWPFFWLQLGNSYLKQGEFKKAEEVFANCLKYQKNELYNTDCREGLQMAKDKNKFGFKKDFEKIIRELSDF